VTRGFAAHAAERYERFFFAPCDARLLAVLRIGFATLVLAYALAMLPSARMLWSEDGMLPLSAVPVAAGGFVPTLLSLLPSSDVWLWTGYALLVLHAGLLLLGYRSRLQLLGLLIWLVSLQNRNPLVLNGQDALLRLIGVFLLGAPLGACWSFDRLRESEKAVAPYWPIRLLQLQIAVVMLSAGIWKLRGDDWTSGNALYYVTRLEGFWGNLPLPHSFVHSRSLLRVLTFGTLVLELSVPILIWTRRLRRASLVTALLFHAGLGYAMNLFLFAPIMMLGWCSFLERADFEDSSRLLRRLLGSRANQTWWRKGAVT